MAYEDMGTKGCDPRADQVTPREHARLRACRLLLEAAAVLGGLPSIDRTTRIDCLVAELILCWKHVRDMEIGDQNKAP